MVTRVQIRSTGGAILQVRIELRGTKPKVWRRVLVPQTGSISSENVRLTKVLRTATLRYVYDFGDYWDHRITIEKTHAADALVILPFCIAGACATPPEDCGGVPGYAEFVRAMADPNDSEYAYLAEWIGTDSWDPKAFDSTDPNDRLAAIKL